MAWRKAEPGWGWDNWAMAYPCRVVHGRFTAPRWCRRALIAATVAVCGAALPGLSGAQPAVVKIGHAAPTRGWLARVGIECENAARMAVDELNRRGMALGGQHVVFELVAVDDAGDAGHALAAAQSLVAAQVSGVVGHMLTGATVAAAPVYAQAGIPQLSPSATGAAYTRQGHATAFRLLADDTRIGQLLGRHAVDELQAVRLLVVDDRSPYGQGLAEAFSSAAVAAGGQIVGVQHVDPDATDFRALLSAARDQRPDAVFFGGMDRQAGLLIRQMRRLGMATRFIGGDGVCTPDLVSYWAVGEALDGQVVCALPAGVPDTRDAAMARFIADYAQRYRVPPEFYGAYAYDAVMVLADAMARADSATPARVLPALAATRGYRGLTGIITFDHRGDVRLPEVTLHTYRHEERQAVRTLR
jgi:branched-chain amino acid transport system substrate-binding protein